MERQNISTDFIKHAITKQLRWIVFVSKYYHRKPLGPTMCVYWPVGCTKLKWIKTFDQGFNVIETSRKRHALVHLKKKQKCNMLLVRAMMMMWCSLHFCAHCSFCFRNLIHEVAEKYFSRKFRFLFYILSKPGSHLSIKPISFLWGYHKWHKLVDLIFCDSQKYSLFMAVSNTM